MTPGDRMTFELLLKAPGYLVNVVVGALPQTANVRDRVRLLEALTVALGDYIAHLKAKPDHESGT